MNLLAVLDDVLKQQYNPNWIENHLSGFICIVLFILGVIIDLWLKLVKKTSISEYIWMICTSHPTLYSLGFIMTIGTMYLVRDQWGLVGLAGYLGGHLFSGISPSTTNTEITVTKTSSNNG